MSIAVAAAAAAAPSSGLKSLSLSMRRCHFSSSLVAASLFFGQS